MNTLLDLNFPIAKGWHMKCTNTHTHTEHTHGPIVFCGLGIVVTGGIVDAAGYSRRGTNKERLPVLLWPIAVDEDLTVQLPTQCSVSGELADQDLQICSGDTIGVSIQGIPRPTNGVVNGNVPPRSSESRVKVVGPRMWIGSASSASIFSSFLWVFYSFWRFWYHSRHR